MLLNLSGAHAPFFTRNLLILTDSAGRTGVGEVPGGEKIRQTLADSAPLVVGQPIGAHAGLLQRWRLVRQRVWRPHGTPLQRLQAARARARNPRRRKAVAGWTNSRRKLSPPAPAPRVK